MINENNKGYTLLFAIIVSAMVLSIATFILSVSRKQFILTSAARESTLAIYAADSGIQCAVMGYQEGLFSTTTQFIITCEGQVYFPQPQELDGSTALALGLNASESVITTSELPLTIGLGCAMITIIDGRESAAPNRHKVIIESRGYNIYDDENSNIICPKKTPRTEERAIRLIYND
ncbi:MAG: hypothetical protein WC648_02715 [Candidatus Paceibacterota bacterium]|jgi:hypothetical protein